MMDGGALGTMLILAIVAGGLMILVRRAKRSAQHRQARIAQARPATATVIQPGRSLGQPAQRTVNLRLRLSVASPDAAPYEQTTVWDIDLAHLPQLQPGAVLAVKLDQQDQRIIYPQVPWATYSWLYQQSGAE